MITDEMLTSVLKLPEEPKLRSPDAYLRGAVKAAEDAAKGRNLKRRDNIGLMVAHENAHLLNGLSAVLRGNGFSNCQVTADSERMTKVLKQGHVEALVVSMDMADLDVPDMIGHIRRAEWGLCDPFIPVIAVMKGYNDAEIRRVVSSGCDRILGEPVVPADLIDRLERIALTGRDFIIGDDYVGPEGDGTQGQMMSSEYGLVTGIKLGPPPDGDRVEVPNVLYERLVRDHGVYDNRTALARYTHVLSLRRSGVRLSEMQRLIGSLVIHGEAGSWPRGAEECDSFEEAVERAITLCKDGVRRAAGTEIHFIGDICRSTLLILKAIRPNLPNLEDRDAATLIQLNQCFSVSRFNREEGLLIAPLILEGVEKAYGKPKAKPTKSADLGLRRATHLPDSTEDIRPEDQALTPALEAALDALSDSFDFEDEDDAAALPSEEDLALPKELVSKLKGKATERGPFMMELPKGSAQTKLTALMDGMIPYQFSAYWPEGLTDAELPPKGSLPFPCVPAFAEELAILNRQAVIPGMMEMRSILHWIDSTLEAGLDPQSILFEICSERGTFVQGWDVAWANVVSPSSGGGDADDPPGWEDGLPPMPPLPGEKPVPVQTAAAKGPSIDLTHLALWTSMLGSRKYGLSKDEARLVSDLLFVHPPKLRVLSDSLDGPRARFAAGMIKRDVFLKELGERLTRAPEAAAQALALRILLERRELAELPSYLAELMSHLERAETRFALIHGFHKRLIAGRK